MPFPAHWLHPFRMSAEDRLQLLLRNPDVGPETRRWVYSRLYGRRKMSDTWQYEETPQEFVDRMMMYERLSQRDARNPDYESSMPVKNPFSVLPVWVGRRRVEG